MFEELHNYHSCRKCAAKKYTGLIIHPHPCKGNRGTNFITMSLQSPLKLWPSDAYCTPCMWVTHTYTHTPFPAVQPSQLCLLPCPPTSAAQKQYPAFSTQMEVTPYASKPLSFCQGSWGLAALVEVTMEESDAVMQRRTPLHSSSFFFSPSVLSLPAAVIVNTSTLIFLSSRRVSECSLCSSWLRPPVCASVHLLKVLWQHHLLNINAPPKQQFACEVCHKAWQHAFWMYTLVLKIIRCKARATFHFLCFSTLLFREHKVAHNCHLSIYDHFRRHLLMFWAEVLLTTAKRW